MRQVLGGRHVGQLSSANAKPLYMNNLCTRYPFSEEASRPRPGLQAAALSHGQTGLQPSPAANIEALYHTRVPAACPVLKRTKHSTRQPCSQVATQALGGAEVVELLAPVASESTLSLSSPLVRDVLVFVLAGVGAKLWTKIFDILVRNGVLEQNLSRKLVHTTTGPIFVLTWPLFSASPSARLFAAAVPLLNMLRLLSVGLGFVKDDGLVGSVSRSGDRQELLKGPLYYCIVLVATALVTWRSDPAGLVAISLMCGGDGLADIIGRRFGSTNKLPFNKSKSLAGSLAMLVGGTLMALGLISAFWALGCLDCPAAVTPLMYLPALLACSAAATVVEALPINHIFDDNLSVPLVAAAAAMLLLPHAAAAAAVAAVSLS